jgi:hypothetical protein
VGEENEGAHAANARPEEEASEITAPDGDNMWGLPAESVAESVAEPAAEPAAAAVEEAPVEEAPAPEAPVEEAPAPEAPAPEAVNGPVAETMETVGANKKEQTTAQTAVSDLLKNTSAGTLNPVVASITAAGAARGVGATVEEQAAAAAGASAEAHVEGLGSNHATTLKGAEGAAKGVLIADPSADPGEARELAETATRLAEAAESTQPPSPPQPKFSKDQQAEINADVNKVFKEKLISRATELVENGVADTDAKPGWVVAVNALNLRGLRGEPDTNKDTYYFYRHRGTGDTRDSPPTAKNMGPEYTYRPGSPRQRVPGHGALEGHVRFKKGGGSRKKRSKSKPKSKSRATRKRGSKSRRRK